MLTECTAEGFLTLGCIPIGLDVILPVVILASLLCASWTVYHRAVAIHGEAEIPLPAETAHPANFWPTKYPPGSNVPVWMLAHIAETECDSGAKSVVELI
ncbi:hypothetical protein B0H17DRAFT_1199514 [Mycena rosella]|uniref:Uncharacterized protein n=1 Tax=Mycena rosella TaxID=1033263 RepID=A0AAD7GJJ2_MYCRO|nr:hypothetical protein B0H17DRAFT_1199514 [Mycena rosella]